MFDSDMSITGKYATYWKALCKTPGNAVETSTNFKIFDSYISAYMVAPILGLMNHKKGVITDADKEIKDSAGMMAEVQIKYQKRLKYIYQLIILTDDTLNISDQERVMWAFNPSEDDVKRGMKLYTDYFFGGLDILYERFVKGCTTDDDFLTMIHQFVKETDDEYKMTEADTDLEKMLK